MKRRRIRRIRKKNCLLVFNSSGAVLYSIKQNILLEHNHDDDDERRSRISQGNQNEL